MQAMTRPILKMVSLAVLALLSLAIVYLVVQANRRPPLAPYDSLALPAAQPEAALRVRFAGVATLLFDDGETAWMTDGFFSRPPLTDVLFRRIEPDRGAIERWLNRLAVKKLAAVVPVHTHYDHAMDAPLVALHTGALLVGSASTLNVGRGLALPESRLREVHAGDSVAFGRWKLTFIASRHVPTPYTGDQPLTIDAPLKPPQRALAWREGQSWSIGVEHAGGARMLVHGSAGFVPGHLDGQRADVVFLGVGSAGRQSPAYRARLWDEVVKRTGARRVIPIHWDDFTRPLEEPLVALPFLFDDLGATMADLSQWAAGDGIELRMPPLFTPFAP